MAAEKTVPLVMTILHNWFERWDRIKTLVLFLLDTRLLKLLGVTVTAS